MPSAIPGGRTAPVCAAEQSGYLQRQAVDQGFSQRLAEAERELKGLRDEYPFEKDNNPVGNFATTVSDRSRPLNDKVNEKTTLLNDTSSRYNSAVEALNRFIQKYDSVLRDILSAI